MPLTRRRFGTGMAVLLGLCTAGTGCQSAATRSNLYAIRGAPPARMAVAQPVAVAPHPVRQPIPAVVASTDYAHYRDYREVQAGPPASMSGGERTVIASTWHTVAHGSTEQAVANPPETMPQLIAQSSAPLRVAAAGNQDLPQNQAILPTPQPVVPEVTAEVNPGCAADQPRLVPEASVAVAMAEHPLMRPAVPREDAKQPFPVYRVEPPDILLIQASAAVTPPIQRIEGPHLVRPDGTISLGVYGSVYVAGLTLEEIRDVVAARIKAFRDQVRASSAKIKDEQGTEIKLEDLPIERIKLEVTVDVLAYNSKVYYVITDGGGYGEQVYSFVATGNETVLDALAKINGLPAVASKKRIWLARATSHGGAPQVLPVDWRMITQLGLTNTNYQVFPGDRIYVNSDPKIRTDSFLAKTLAPVERVPGVTLLGSSTVNSIRNRGTSGTGSTVP